MQKVQSNGMQIALDDLGDKAAPAVMLIPGLGMARWMWPESFLDTLLRGGYRLICIDNRDCGQSSLCRQAVRPKDVFSAVAATLLRLPVRGAYGLEAMAEDALGVADGLGLRNFHVAGISMGGMIAQVICSIAPERVATLTSIASASGNPRTGLGKLSTVWTVLEPSDPQDSPAKKKERFNRVLNAIGSDAFPRSEEERQKIFARMEEQASGQSVEGTARQLMAILHSGDRRSQLAGVRVPGLVIHGSEDTLLPLAAGREVAELLPVSRLEIIDGMGHDLPEVLGKPVAERMLPWLAAHPF